MCNVSFAQFGPPMGGGNGGDGNGRNRNNGSQTNVLNLEGNAPKGGVHQKVWGKCFLILLT